MERESRTFRCHRIYPVFSALGFVFSLGLSFGALEARPENGGGLAWPALLFLTMTAVCFWLLWCLSPEYEVDEVGITQKRFGLTRRLRWSEIYNVEHRAFRSALLVESASKRLRIQRLTRDFLELLRIIKHFAPAESLESAIPFPFVITASWNLRVYLGCLTAFFVARGMEALAAGDVERGAMTLSLTVPAMGLMVWHSSLRYEFDRSGLRVVYPFRTVKYDAATFTEMTLVQRALDIALILRFGGKRVELSDMQIVVAPERVFDSLLRGVGSVEGLGEGNDSHPLE